MSTGFMQRFKGKIKAHSVWVGKGGIAYNETTGVAVYANAGAPSNGTTLAGLANPGDILVDVTNFVFYMNTNTLASPTWTAQSGGGGGAGSFTTGAFSGLVSESTTNTITAHSGGGQGSAVALTKQFNRITVVAANTDSVKLPAATAGLAIIVFNDDATHDAAVYPSTGDTIDGGSANASVVLSHTKRAVYICFTAGAWVSAQLGVASA